MVGSIRVIGIVIVVNELRIPSSSLYVQILLRNKWSFRYSRVVPAGKISLVPTSACKALTIHASPIRSQSLGHISSPDKGFSRACGFSYHICYVFVCVLIHSYEKYIQEIFIQKKGVEGAT